MAGQKINFVFGNPPESYHKRFASTKQYNNCWRKRPYSSTKVKWPNGVWPLRRARRPVVGQSFLKFSPTSFVLLFCALHQEAKVSSMVIGWVGRCRVEPLEKKWWETNMSMNGHITSRNLTDRRCAWKNGTSLLWTDSPKQVFTTSIKMSVKFQRNLKLPIYFWSVSTSSASNRKMFCRKK